MLFFESLIQINPMILFGLILLLGLIGGEITKLSRYLPRITGYLIIGFAVGPYGLNIIDEPMLENTRLFIDISLSLILFEIGRHLNINWLKSDLNLLRMATVESGFTFILVFVLLYFVLGLMFISSLLGAAIAMSTSPAITMMVASDLSAEGPVTRRALILTSLNNGYSLILFTLLVPLTAFYLPHYSLKSILLNTLYFLFGSVALGMITFKIASTIARIIGKREHNQFILFVGAVILTLGLTQMLNLSPLLSLFVLGVSARNLDDDYVFMEIDFKRFARLFFIILFVVTGAYLKPLGIYHATWATIAFLSLRVIGKITGVWLFATKCRLTPSQMKAISLTLLPMGGVAVGMSNRLMDFNPILATELLPIITLSIVVLNIIGPILTQFSLIKAGETDPSFQNQKKEENGKTTFI